MIYPGLVSITFRKLQPEEIIRLVSKAGLHSIEWGGDIHVPHGNLKLAAEVGAMTREAGLAVASYGSYYLAGELEKNNCTYDEVLETAKVLGAPMVRIWAGDRGSGASDTACWERVVTDVRKMAEASEKLNIGISFEYHSNTLTDSCESAVKLMKDISHKNAGCYWQPNIGQSEAGGIQEISALKPWITNIHAFHCQGSEKRPLIEGFDIWSRYLGEIAKLPGDRNILLEFVKEDLPQQFLEDAETLKKLIRFVKI